MRQCRGRDPPPASITKVMTLFLTFDALASGRLGLDDRVPISRHAAAQRPSSSASRPAARSACDAIQVVAVKSANDIAVALGEKLGGSETTFARMMTDKARMLGMKATYFANASGLNDASNFTTARDLAILSSSLIRSHPDYYSYFGQRFASYGRQRFANHNPLLGQLPGMDGIKTGFTNDAGFTLAASATRGGRRLIAVVLGEPSVRRAAGMSPPCSKRGFRVLDKRTKGDGRASRQTYPTPPIPRFAACPAMPRARRTEIRLSICKTGMKSDRPADPFVQRETRKRFFVNDLFLFPSPNRRLRAGGDPAAAPCPRLRPDRRRASLVRRRGPDLLAAIGDARREGLNPADYNPQALQSAIDAGEGAQLDARANAAGLALARDYFLGRVRDYAAFDWHIERSAYEAYALTDGLGKAAAEGRVRRWLGSLLPADPQYQALRDALAAAGAPADIARIRANMERWRWMPRALGADYLLVNVPAYRLRVTQGGIETASYDVVVGKPKTPTPALVAPAQALVVNPWWTLPPNVLAEGGRLTRARGFVETRDANGKRVVRQRPGPANALGRLKIDMPNPQAIYLHDTPAKVDFARKNRALSHGCIRVRDIARLAGTLRDDGALGQALGRPTTVTLPVARPLPVYIVYLTAEAQGGRLIALPDIYARDARLVAALDAGARG